MLSFLKNIFKPKPLVDRLRLGESFGVIAGTYLGEIFVFIRRDESTIHFLSIPKMYNRSIPIKKFNYAVDNNIIEYIKRIPWNERRMCCSQFDKNKKS